MAEKTQEERVLAAKIVLHQYRQTGLQLVNLHELAEKILEAADAPPKPTWPTDETMASLSFIFNGSVSEWNDTSRELVAKILRDSDPLLRAVSKWYYYPSTEASRALNFAVREANL